MNYLNIIRNNWQTIAVVTLAVVVLSLIFSLIQPLEYRSRVELLIVQKQTMSMDAYAAARASEKLARNLSLVIKTKSFFDKVIASDFGIRRGDFPVEEKKLRKVWQKKVSTKISPETSLLRVDVFDKDKKTANKLAQAVAYVLVNDSAEYHGGGEDVKIRVVNDPLVSDYPVKPNIILNSATGLLAGLILSLGWVFYKTNKEIKTLTSDLTAEAQDFPPQNFESELEEQQVVAEDIFKPRIRTMYDHLSKQIHAD